MGKIIYVPLEHIDGRYTVHMDRDIEQYLRTNHIEYVKVMPNLETPALPKGMFLNAPFTSRFKAKQLQYIATMYENDQIADTDRFFFSDIWFPGIESIAYMNYFTGKRPQITGVLHAGSFTDTDFVRDLERWAKNFEDIVFDISSQIFVASNFIRNDVIKKRMVDPAKVQVTGLPLDFVGLDQYKNTSEKQDVVIFNGRLCDEKQPWLFDELNRQVNVRMNRPIQFIKTQEHNLTKTQYYQLLSTSKAVVSYALQENFGFGVAEAVYLGCQPILPNRLVYPELYSKEHLYDRFEQSIDMVCAALDNPKSVSVTFDHACFDKWFK